MKRFPSTKQQYKNSDNFVKPKRKSIPFTHSQDAIIPLPIEDDMEIVVVSDTVRQRRSRTPSSTSAVATSNDDTKEHSGVNVMPDLLPKTFHLVESSALFSQIQNNSDELMTEAKESNHKHFFAVVEIRESNIATPKWAVGKSEPAISENSIEVSNTCSILESVNYMEPSNVETVHIVDVTSEPSDTETCPTPNPDDRTANAALDTETDSENEYDTGEPYMPSGHSMDLPSRRSRLSRARDLENTPSAKPTVVEMLPVCDNFHDADVDDEPLIFSDDDEQFADHVQSANRQTVHTRTKCSALFESGKMFPILISRFS